MVDFTQLVEHLFYNGKRGYTRTEGNVAYLDGTRLSRPIDMSKPQRIFVVVLVGIGIIIGAFIIKDTVVRTIQSTVLAEQTISDNISRPASLESLPSLVSLIDLSDEEIVAALEQTGDTFYRTPEASEAASLALRRVPADVTLDEASSLFARGMGSLTASEATRLLTGSWMLTMERVSSPSVVVRYADFSTGNTQTALLNALEKEAFDRNAMTEQGEDDSGNTFMTGTLATEASSCVWRISALPLSDVYSISGLPANACYVGIRLTRVGDAPAA